jgi:hypothetical protein
MKMRATNAWWAVLAGASACPACGGTSGQPDLTSLAEAGADATLVEAGTPVGDAADSGTFDVTIPYADPTRLAAYEAGVIVAADATTDAYADDGGGDSEASVAVVVDAAPAWTTWPACACDYTVGDNFTLVLDDASACTNVTYTATAACDYGIRNTNSCDVASSSTPGSEHVFPPCCAFIDAGLPGQGAPEPSKTKFQLCAELFDCLLGPDKQFASMARPLMWGAAGMTPYCGDPPDGAAFGTNGWCELPNAAHGPCKTQVENAFETTDPTVIFSNWGSDTLGSVGSEGATVTNLFACLVFNADSRSGTQADPYTNACFYPLGYDDAGADGSDAAGEQ